ncbi:hypothetical protein M231_07733 [Tremella mesenterica]|uniref:Uncharacterized protein n=1 Tax=Tremella mesenterica TaxID=5217 RepID=A0A4Q1BFN1_TREME|nr:uncharacterized protein TREMEDRAFT_65316 [Tremella mesenterica DSM 1558]EIW66459.1 hypothetical protein TREMEDRAFT_65316 [Tremella mesenterica DSM 1558]RXK35003.1 hypothetical protein M231_07733 [Tremella mesenterica]
MSSSGSDSSDDNDSITKVNADSKYSMPSDADSTAASMYNMKVGTDSRYSMLSNTDTIAASMNNMKSEEKTPEVTKEESLEVKSWLTRLEQAHRQGKSGLLSVDNFFNQIQLARITQVPDTAVILLASIGGTLLNIDLSSSLHFYNDKGRHGWMAFGQGEDGKQYELSPLANEPIGTIDLNHVLKVTTPTISEAFSLANKFDQVWDEEYTYEVGILLIPPNLSRPVKARL